MRETLIEQWHREAGQALKPPVLQQCVTGAARGAQIGLALLLVFGAIGWLGFF
ncbi:hypothetical protein DHODJN_03365 [Methylorubrum extorquens]